MGLVQVQVLDAEEGEAAVASEDEAGNSELESDIVGPSMVRARDHAARSRTAAAEMICKGMLQEFASIEEVDHQVAGRDGVDALAALRQACFDGRETEGDEADREAGISDAIDGRTDARRVGRGGDDGDGRAMLGEQTGDVDHGEHVARGEPWDENEVEAVGVRCGPHDLSSRGGRRREMGVIASFVDYHV